MKIGCVKEIKPFEYRVGIIPENIKEFKKNGHSVYIEKNSGKAAGFLDCEYKKNGGKIIDSAEKIWSMCDLIIKIKEPLKQEYKLMKKKQIIFSFFHLAANKKLLNNIIKSKSIAIAYESIENEKKELLLLKPMSEVAGKLSVSEGAHALGIAFGGNGVLLSGLPGVKKGEVVIIGAGIVGQNACKIAIGLGAKVTVLDINIKLLNKIEEKYKNCVQTLFSNEQNIKKSLKKADLVIGSVLIPGKNAPKIIKKKYLKLMKPKSIIVDVAIDQGGCSETSRPTTHLKPTYIVNNIIHYCVANIPSIVAKTSTEALINATLPYSLLIANNNLKKLILKNKDILKGIICYNGKITSKPIAKTFNKKYYKILDII